MNLREASSKRLKAVLSDARACQMRANGLFPMLAQWTSPASVITHAYEYKTLSLENLMLDVVMKVLANAVVARCGHRSE